MEKGKGLITHIGIIGHIDYNPNTLTMEILNDHIEKVLKEKVVTDPCLEERKKRMSEDFHIATVELRERSFPTGREKRRERRKQARKSK